MLIDGGGVRDGSFDTGARIVEPFLRARGIGRIDVVALSHPHPDHLNGLFRILERFDVGAFWSSGDDGHNPEYRRLVARRARSAASRSPKSSTTRLGGATVVPLGPFGSDPDGTGERIARARGLSVNDASLVLRVAFAGRGVAVRRAIWRPTARVSWPGGATPGRRSRRTCSRCRTTAAARRRAPSWSTRSRRRWR